MNNWISVKDNLPQKDCVVIAVLQTLDWCKQNKKVICICCYYSNNKTFIKHDGKYDDVVNITHWMPLPEPPKC